MVMKLPEHVKFIIEKLQEAGRGADDYEDSGDYGDIEEEYTEEEAAYTPYTQEGEDAVYYDAPEEEYADEDGSFYEWHVENGKGYLAELSTELWKKERKSLHIIKKILLQLHVQAVSERLSH